MCYTTVFSSQTDVLDVFMSGTAVASKAESAVNSHSGVNSSLHNNNNKLWVIPKQAKNDNSLGIMQPSNKIILSNNNQHNPPLFRKSFLGHRL